MKEDSHLRVLASAIEARRLRRRCASADLTVYARGDRQRRVRDISQQSGDRVREIERGHNRSRNAPRKKSANSRGYLRKGQLLARNLLVQAQKSVQRFLVRRIIHCNRGCALQFAVQLRSLLPKGVAGVQFLPQHRLRRRSGLAGKTGGNLRPSQAQKLHYLQILLRHSTLLRHLRLLVSRSSYTTAANRSRHSNSQGSTQTNRHISLCWNSLNRFTTEPAHARAACRSLPLEARLLRSGCIFGGCGF